ncbi:hypothetical protein [Actinoplanes sp. URMC 104]|uniref:hypothetical protein n=1 Tax=Actinoplanes sp. URMC 104 TaxID=3423409 RepID=UPI003F1BE3FC
MSGLEDELCRRLGPLLDELSSRRDKYVGPEHFAPALLAAAAGAVDGEEVPPGARQVLAAVLGIMPGELAREVGWEPDEKRPVGEVSWTRDRYGSRFAVLAPFAPPGDRVRWYLWDVDACAQPITVHSGYYASPEEALADWRAGVGGFASAGARWAPIDDTVLLEAVLPRVEGMIALGGESVEQFAEYLRCRRLAEIVLAEVREDPARGPRPGVPEPAAFVQWRVARGVARRDDADLAEALAEVWPREVAELYSCCSPHRIAHVVLALRDEFGDDYAEQARHVLPDWVAWLSERAGTAPELVDRALAAAEGQPRPALGAQDYRARIAE